MSACPVQPGPAIREVYIINKVPHWQRLAFHRSKKPKFRTGIYRLWAYVWDALHCMRYEHGRQAPELLVPVADHRFLSPQNSSVWDWVGEILEVYVVEHIEAVLGMSFAEFVERRKRGETITQIRRQRRAVLISRCPACGHVRARVADHRAMHAISEAS
jgi:hypothetical protein